MFREHFCFLLHHLPSSSFSAFIIWHLLFRVFHYIGILVLKLTLPLTSEHWSCYMMVLLSHYHELSHHGTSQAVQLYFSFLYCVFLVNLASVSPQRLHLNQIIFNKLDLLALLMFLSSVSILARVIYIFLSPD